MKQKPNSEESVQFINLNILLTRHSRTFAYVRLTFFPATPRSQPPCTFPGLLAFLNLLSEKHIIIFTVLSGNCNKFYILCKCTLLKSDVNCRFFAYNVILVNCLILLQQLWHIYKVETLFLRFICY